MGARVAVLPLTRHQCRRLHCENSRVAHSAEQEKMDAAGLSWYSKRSSAKESLTKLKNETASEQSYIFQK